MSRLLRGDDGTAAVEFGLVATVLVLLLTLAAPLGGLLGAHVETGRATAEGLRFATKVQSNPGHPHGYAGCSDMRRVSTSQVAERVRESLGMDEVTVTTVPEELCDAAAGQFITVQVRRPHDMGVAGAAANRAAGLFSSGPVFPNQQTTVSAEAHGVRE